MRQKEIIEIKPKGKPGDVSSSLLLDRVYRNRGLASADDIDYHLKGLIPPLKMKGIEEAARLIAEHVSKGSKIIVVGDYDVDGASAISMAMEGFEILGVRNADFIVPDRMVHGYGLTPSIVELAEKQKPDLIITVDNGIASFDGAKAVKALPFPCDLIITDHHLPAAEGLPDAAVIVNPNQPECTFPSKNLCGCGVMFYLIMALRIRMRGNGMIPADHNDTLYPLFDLAALATVADVVPLDKNNRILVDAGLNKIKAGNGRPGICALLELGGRSISDVTSSDFGFTVGPRINSAGRLDDMTIGIRCLLAKTHEDGMQWGEMLNRLNKERKSIESEMVDGANEILREADTDKISKKSVACLYSGDWHEGVIGILASRVKDKVNRPTLCFTDTSERRVLLKKLKEEREKTLPNKKEIASIIDELKDSEIKGSARSIPGIHLKHLLDTILKSNPEILVRMGGHAMAAGMVIKHQYFDKFSRILNDVITKSCPPEVFEDKVFVDIKNMSSSEISVENAEAIKLSGPWGHSFIEPIFSSRFHIRSLRLLKEKHLKLVLLDEQGEKPVDGIFFNFTNLYDELPDGTIDVVYKLSINEWRGKKTAQILIESIQSASD